MVFNVFRNFLLLKTAIRSTTHGIVWYMGISEACCGHSVFFCFDLLFLGSSVGLGYVLTK